MILVTDSLSVLHPDIAAQWHPTRNGALPPDQVYAGSYKKYWWQCTQGPDHEWEASVYNRSAGGRGCPYCSGLKVSVTNSLAALHPDIAAQWHPAKNGSVTPVQVLAGSSRRYWWKCLEGPDHEWEATVNNRTRGTGCSFCSGLKTSVTNSLATLYPDIAAQWHPTKNGAVTADQVVAGSNGKYWWQCPEGSDHEWEARVESRTSLGTGCPCCSGRKLSVTNSLAALHPDIAAQWHPTRNGAVTANQIVGGSHNKCWWQCPEGCDHEWEAMVITRTGGGRGCPYCSGLKVSITNSLAALHQDIAAQWHPTKNGSLSPDQVVAGSGRKYWWKCPQGPDHEWEATVNLRTGGGTGCPCCSSLKASVTNSLATLNPDIAAQWHPAKNGAVTPDQVVAGSGKKYWWKCSEGSGHEWEAMVYKRTGGGQGCPFCSGPGYLRPAAPN